MERAPINKKTLEYLAELARIEIRGKDEDKLLKDLQKILEYSEELKEVDTKDVEPMAGGTIKVNVFRNDETAIECQTLSARLIGQFPEGENGFLKIPPVFE